MSRDKFHNTIPYRAFQATNAIWNEYCLNAPWSVGYVSSLIETEHFAKKEDWEDFYYKSGEERCKILAQYNPRQQAFLNNHTLQKTRPDQLQKLPYHIKNINFQYGRTQAELQEKGLILFKSLEAQGQAIAEEYCIAAVRFRVICETWNGIILRERNAIDTLKQHFPKAEFHKTDGDFDHLYAVDYEMFNNGNLVCGLQIKPKSYNNKQPYLLKAKKANQRKNAHYQRDFGKPVFDIIARTNGEVLNLSDFKEWIMKL